MGGIVCSAGSVEFDDAFESLAFPWPLGVAATVISNRPPPGLRVFLFNLHSRMIAGPFYARQMAAQPPSSLRQVVGVRELCVPNALHEKAAAGAIRSAHEGTTGLIPDPDSRPCLTADLSEAEAQQLEAALLGESRDDQPLAPKLQCGRDLRELGGAIFSCDSSETERRFLRKGMCGTPHAALVYVQHLHAGMPVFLYNVSMRTLCGVLRAAGAGGLSPDAQAPQAQVQVDVPDRLLRLKHSDYSGLIAQQATQRSTSGRTTQPSFHCDLSPQEAASLVALFEARAREVEQREAEAAKLIAQLGPAGDTCVNGPVAVKGPEGACLQRAIGRTFGATAALLMTAAGHMQAALTHTATGQLRASLDTAEHVLAGMQASQHVLEDGVPGDLGELPPGGDGRGPEPSNGGRAHPEARREARRKRFQRYGPKLRMPGYIDPLVPVSLPGLAEMAKRLGVRDGGVDKGGKGDRNVVRANSVLEAAVRQAEVALRGTGAAAAGGTAAASTRSGSLEGHTYVIFDTCVFMHESRSVIPQWVADNFGGPHFHLLLPRVVGQELFALAYQENRSSAPDARIGLAMLTGLRTLRLFTEQSEHERHLPHGPRRARERRGDDGILDCLVHFALRGANVILCTRDRKFYTRFKAQGHKACSPGELADVLQVNRKARRTRTG
ncbi:hypothetical protein WJX81_007897 [Elliptochloris bilobata]|uniref:DCD domain-containing protein n=1 Tax=Elliptochloris bilobata TaxID=381761 RepID=A0AAW1SFI1_9CHLO